MDVVSSFGFLSLNFGLARDYKEEEIRSCKSGVVPWGIEPQSKVPETFILSVILRDHVERVKIVRMSLWAYKLIGL